MVRTQTTNKQATDLFNQWKQLVNHLTTLSLLFGLLIKTIVNVGSWMVLGIATTQWLINIADGK